MVPLLVAMDAVCRRGVVSSEDSVEVKPLQRGRRPNAEKHAGLDAPYDLLIADLARDWRLSEETVRDYLEVDHPFYYPQAVGFVHTLLNLDWDPRVTLSEVAQAIAEHRPKYRTRKLTELQPGYQPLNLLPYLRRVRQPGGPKGATKRRNLAAKPGKAPRRK
jgi:hypothetical protein